MKKFIDNLEEYIIAVLICGMIAFEAFNALLGAFGAGIHGIPEEFAIYCYVWIAFLSAAFCAKRGCDVAVTMLSEKYGPAAQRPLALVNGAINTLLSVCLLIGAFGLVARTAADGTAGKLSGFPLTPVYISSIAGYALCLVRNVQRLITTAKAPAAQ